MRIRSHLLLRAPDGDGAPQGGGGGGAPPAGAPPAGGQGGGKPPASVIAPPKGGDGGGGSWSDGFDDDTRGWIRAGGFKGPADVVKKARELEGTIGNRIAIPGEKAKPEEWNTFFAKLGRPESSDKYDLGDFKPRKDLPWNDGHQKLMLGEFHKLGMTNRQAQGAMKAYEKLMGDAWDGDVAAIGAHAKETEKTLMQRHGKDKYEKRRENAGALLRGVAGKRMEALAEVRMVGGKPLLDHPEIVDFLADLADLVMENDVLPSQFSGGAVGNVNSPQGAKAEIDKIYAAAKTDPKHAYNDKKHPDHQAVHARMLQLQELANKAA